MLTGKEYLEVKTVEVGRQWCNIDIWAEINDDTFLMIEDKTNTTIHDNQLERYKNSVLEAYEGKRKNLFYIYIKTGSATQISYFESWKSLVYSDYTPL